jgi:hypothetical protein
MEPLIGRAVFVIPSAAREIRGAERPDARMGARGSSRLKPRLGTQVLKHYLLQA